MSKVLEFKQPGTSEETESRPVKPKMVFDFAEAKEKYLKNKEKISSEPLTVYEIYELISINQIPEEDIEDLCQAEGVNEEAIHLFKIIAEQMAKIKDYEEILQNRSSPNKQSDIVVRSLLKRIQILEEELKAR